MAKALVYGVAIAGEAVMRALVA
ncbi:MAG: hypothetical protein JWN39_415, partial [Ilumatobacteraceae bacterium]|nr:hypothetical protein [Ilumatobacteraceae bacterium]